MESQKYKIIYADPAWKFNNSKTGGSLKSGAVSKYSVMSIEDIKNLPIDEISDDNCILFLWWVGSMPLEAIGVVEAWGFKLKTMTGFVWIKKTKNWLNWFGMGFWTRAGSECCLIATKGSPKKISGSVRSVVEAICSKHSKKPLIFSEKIIELMGDVSRVELFARDNKPGWSSWGNEIENSINL